MRSPLCLSSLVLASLPALAWAQVPAGGEFRVNTYTTNLQFGPRLAADAEGSFVVTWFSYLQDGSLGGIFGQRFSAAGAPQGAEFQVNTYTTNYQYSPAVAMDAKGNFMVVWQSFGQDGSGAGVFGQRFSAGGVKRGSEFRVNAYTTSAQQTPMVASDAAGNFVVAWESSGQDGSSGYGIFGQRFDTGGIPLGAEFRVNTYTTSYQRSPSVAMARDGSFVVTWDSNLQDGNSTGVFARHYDAAGVPLAGEFAVSTYTTGRQGISFVSADENGNFVVSWQTPQDGSLTAVFARRYDSGGGPRGPEFQVNTYTTGYQSVGVVASDAVGNFVVTWTSPHDGSPNGVFGQRFGGLLPAALALDTTAGGSSDGNRVFEAGETVSVAPSWRNVNGAPQAFRGVASNFTGPGAPSNPTYTIPDAGADYGTVGNALTGSCTTTLNCYSLALSVPTVRPISHWDATVREDLVPPAQGQSKTWTLHVGDSFADVARGNPFYRFIETLLHKSVTGGCTATDYCPFDATTRAQMAVFALVSKEGRGYQPPPCGAPMFNDVAASSPFCRWIEELARRGVVAGCGGGNYCPLSPVNRDQMAVFVLATKEGSGYNPAACVPGAEMFGDVAASSPFCRWIEELARRGVVSGCGGGNYCPTSPVTREQMGVFLTQTFGLLLYEP